MADEDEAARAAERVRDRDTEEYWKEHEPDEDELEEVQDRLAAKLAEAGWQECFETAFWGRDGRVCGRGVAMLLEAMERIEMGADRDETFADLSTWCVEAAVEELTGEYDKRDAGRGSR